MKNIFFPLEKGVRGFILLYSWTHIVYLFVLFLLLLPTLPLLKFPFQALLKLLALAVLDQ